MEEDLDQLADDLEEIEKEVTSIDQYNRRENIVISGINKNIPHDQLEDKVLQIFNKTTERSEENKLTSKDIHACHRLKKEHYEEHAKVIVRFVNRQDSINVYENKKKLTEKKHELGNKEYYLNENLNKRNLEILKEAKKLRKKKLIHSCWSHNGQIFIKIDEETEKGSKILHLNDFTDFFTLDELGWD